MPSASGSLPSIGLPDVIIRLAFVRLHHEHNLADVHSFPSARSNGTIVSMYANGAHRRITRRMRNAGLVICEKRGKQVFYRLRVPCVLNFMECVEEVIRSGAEDQIRMLKEQK